MDFKRHNRFSLELLVKNKSVAVVGNSLSLFDKDHGSKIDMHDVVIRFNKPAILLENSYRSHGTKFDIWAFWSVGAFCNAFIKNECEYTEKLNILLGNNDIKRIQICMNDHEIDTKKYISYTMPIKKYDLLKTNLSKTSKEEFLTPSVGIGILDWLLYSQPRRVSVYGFDFKKTPTFSEIENYEKDMTNRYDARCKHDFRAEEYYASKYIFNDKRFKLII